jgi:hypothetical protein
MKEQLRVFRLRCAPLNMTVVVDMPAVLAEMGLDQGLS